MSNPLIFAKRRSLAKEIQAHLHGPLTFTRHTTIGPTGPDKKRGCNSVLTAGAFTRFTLVELVRLPTDLPVLEGSKTLPRLWTSSRRGREGWTTVPCGSWSSGSPSYRATKCNVVINHLLRSPEAKPLRFHCFAPADDLGLIAESVLSE